MKIGTPKSLHWSKLWELCKILLDEWFHHRWQAYSFEPVRKIHLKLITKNKVRGQKYSIKPTARRQCSRLLPYYTGGIWKWTFHPEKCIKCLSSTLRGGIWKRNDYQSFCGWVKLRQGNHIINVMSSSSTRSVCFWKCFLSTLKRKAGVFKFLRFEECFRKAPFSWRINVDGNPDRRNKAAFSNHGVILTAPKLAHAALCATQAWWAVSK